MKKLTHADELNRHIDKVSKEVSKWPYAKRMSSRIGTRCGNGRQCGHDVCPPREEE